jgi:hypothetical protein
MERKRQQWSLALNHPSYNGCDLSFKLTIDVHAFYINNSKCHLSHTKTFEPEDRLLDFIALLDPLALIIPTSTSKGA